MFVKGLFRFKGKIVKKALRKVPGMKYHLYLILMPPFRQTE